MSLSLYPAKTIVSVTDPRLDFDLPGVQVISGCATQLIYNKFPASNPSGSLLKFNTTQTPTQAISTKMYVEIEFEVDLQLTNAVSVIRDNRFAPRFMPLNSVTTSATLEINSAQNNIFPSQIVDSLLRYDNDIMDLNTNMSTFPSMMDTFQQYNDGLERPANDITPPGGPDSLGYGSGGSVLGQYAEGGSFPQGRGGWPSTLTHSAVVTPRVTKYRFKSYEPVLLSPCIWGGKGESKSLYGVKTLNLTYNLESTLHRVLSINAEGATNEGLTIIGSRIIGIPNLCMTTMTPKLIDRISPVQIYPWAQIQPYDQNTPVVAFNATIPITFNAQQLGGVPKRCYIYAKKTSKLPTDSDSFAILSNLSVRFDGVTGIFAGAPQEQIYQMCASNGYNGSYMSWSKYTGSVICIDFAKDIPMMDYMAVGSAKNINFQITCDLTNNHAVDTAFTFFVQIVNEGVFSIDQFGTSLYQVNLLSVDDVLNSRNVQKIPYNSIDTFAVGGSFTGKLASLGSFAKNLGRKAVSTYEGLNPAEKIGVQNAITDVASFVSPALSKAIKDFGPAAYDKAKALLGMGYSENQIYNLLEGAGMQKKKKKAVTGGKKLTKAQLLRITSG